MMDVLQEDFCYLYCLGFETPLEILTKYFSIDPATMDRGMMRSLGFKAKNQNATAEEIKMEIKRIILDIQRVYKYAEPLIILVAEGCKNSEKDKWFHEWIDYGLKLQFRQRH